jgi:hypothetical protein
MVSINPLDEEMDAWGQKSNKENLTLDHGEPGRLT